MNKILVPIDFSFITPTVMEVAVEQGRLSNGEIVLLHVEFCDPTFVGYEAGPQSVRNSVSSEIRHDHKELKALEEELQQKGLNVTSLLRQGPIVEKILNETRHFEPDLIIMGTHGHGAMHHLILGSISEGVLREAPCPVLLVKSVVK